MNILQYQDAISYIWVHIGYMAPTLKYTKRPVTDEIYPEFDPTYILIIIGVLLSLAASTKVKSTFSRYSGVRSLSGLTGAQTAERILHQAGIYDVGIARISGDLTDHYDPSSKTLR